MGKIEEKSRVLLVNLIYTDDNFKINVTYRQDLITKQVTQIDGTVFSNDTLNTNLGSFNGRNENDKMKYSFNSISLDNLVPVVSAIEEIERSINPKDEQES